MSDLLFEPWPLRGTRPDEPTPDITNAIADAAERLAAERVVKAVAREHRMSLMGKLQHLTESAQDFDKETGAVLDGIVTKITAAKQKRDDAAAKHHGYYDAVIKSVDQSVEVIERLSNLPLQDGGGQ